MKLLKVAGVLVAVAGVGALVLAQERPFGPPGPPERRAWTSPMVGAGRVEIGAVIRDVEASDKTAALGVVVEEIRPASAAEKAGLQRSDVIVEFDGERVRSARQFTRLVRESRAGHAVKATIVRGGQKKELQITPTEGPGGMMPYGERLRERLDHLGERLPSFDFDLSWPGLGTRGRLGITVEELTPQLASYFGVQAGVLVTAVNGDSPAARAGLKAGDVITRANNEPVRSREDLLRSLGGVKEDGEVTLGIVRDRKDSTVTAKIESHRPPRRGRPA